MAASRSRRASADRVHATLFLALNGLSCALVSADASADACPAPIAITRREGDGETLVATLGRDAPCAPIEAPLMRRVAVPGIRLRVESSHGASEQASPAPAVPPVRVRVASRRGNFLSLTSADATTLKAARHPFARGDGVLDQTVEFVAAPSVASEILKALEYVNVDMGILGGGDDGDEYPEYPESPANRTRFPFAACAASSANHRLFFYAVVVEVFAAETDVSPSATVRARVALRSEDPLFSRVPVPVKTSVSLASAFSASRGSLRSTPVLVATCATLAFLVVCARAAVRACLEGSEAREAPPPAPPREASATIQNRA
jgi:hypothetical protein